ncbi:MAG: fumarylacetoacetate hydrolase family protein [Gammaproteobacteria bacterium]|nr:fumarylacetoacetate hydrolase family protein [Gammaproteobacteria bacterium]MXW49705.1 fumarylacetoacetate hydrolase family protein [Gammaproteobacteria bacterium]MYE53497.1 fumarylacetoacetate hydrolase family protein [Gammaproteobacteria bacterium]MYE87238.1 fumarylacetoacetate hydrolase family protein [Gammaproteobacteria bacterium]MYF12085.1 fumarylacetoacetate hydrolase family protein [Gammaproteobacteria bacterium]
MRMLTYCRQGEVRFGAAVGSAVVDLSGRMPRFTSLKSLLAADALAEAQDIVNGADADCPLSDIRWLPPVPDAGKIICIGVNYGNRNAEYGDATPAPAYPSVFMRSRESLTGHLEPLVRPPESTQLDYEGEIALVIGRAGRRIPESRAREHIAGLTLVNEGSVRDWLRHSRFNVTPGKNFERSGAAGPWLVTKDALPNFDELRLTTKVNGELRQNDHTGNLFFSFERLVSYLSTFMRLQPGDLIATGTPTGAGARLDPPQYLVPGDVVEVEVPEIGLLRNGVCDEDVAP